MTAGEPVMELAQAAAWYRLLPTLNAALNGTAAVLLVVGYRAIRRGDVDRHKRLMIGAFLVSAAFLASYLTYHTVRQMHEGVGHTRYSGPELLRQFYYVLLISHILLAIVNLPMIIATLVTGVKTLRTTAPPTAEPATAASLAAPPDPSSPAALSKTAADRRRRHRRISRWTLPLWLYVSITGVLVYVILYYT